MNIEDIDPLNSAVEVAKEPITYAIGKLFRGFMSMDIFDKYSSCHGEMLKAQVQSVRILGMTKPIELKNLYYPAYVTENIARRSYHSEWLDGKEKNQARKSKKIEKKANNVLAEEYIAQNKRVVVLGGPGAGKTTLLKFIALSGVDGDVYRKSNIKNRLFPIFVQLPKFAKEEMEVFDYIVKEVQEKTDEYARDFYLRALSSEDTIVLLDSLDEVGSSHRIDLIDKIKNFGVKFPNVRIVLSCRAADYHEILEDYTEVEIAKLSEDAVRSIVKAWFNDMGEGEKADRLISLLNNDEGVASLTETPLLLSLLCIQYKHDLSLPKRKTELYRRCVDALLKDWDTTRNFRRDTKYSQLSDDKKEKIFENIAGANDVEEYDSELDAGVVVGIVEDFLRRMGESSADAVDVIREMESHHGIIEKASVGTYAFSHFSMHEYFLARYICAKRKELVVFKAHYENDAWFGVLQFIVALMDDPSQVFEFLKEKSNMRGLKNYPPMAKRLRHLWLMFKCLSVGVSIDPHLRSLICEHIANSQFEMAKIYMNDKIFPVANFVRGDIRHTFFYIDKKRSSLADSLLPYRYLSNEILISPQDCYADFVIGYFDEINSNDVFMSDLARHAFLVCLILPLASLRPAWVISKLDFIIENSKHPSFKIIVQNNKVYVEKTYGKVDRYLI